MKRKCFDDKITTCIVTRIVRIICACHSHTLYVNTINLSTKHHLWMIITKDIENITHCWDA